MRVSNVDAHATIVPQGVHNNHVCVVLNGWAATFRIIPNGERQIVAFHLKGDMPDLHSLHLRILDAGIQALTPCRIGYIPHANVLNLCTRYPEIASALWKMTLVDAAIYREWIATLGRQNAYGRIAHVFCEMIARLEAIGESDGVSGPFPATQLDLADVAGISPVHVNRTLQELRKDKIVQLSRRSLRILDRPALEEAARFDPTYLHLERK